MAAIGVWASERDAKDALNAQIDPVHEILLQNKGGKECPRESAGVEDEQWAFQTVSKAVKGAGWHMIKVQTLEGKNELRDIDLAEIMAKGGSYLLDGWLNKSYIRGGKKCKIRAFDPEDNRHSTAVVDGDVFDCPEWILGGKMPMSCLWLKGSEPNEKKGFMRKICRAYRVAKCVQKGDCKWCSAKSKKRARE